MQKNRNQKVLPAAFYKREDVLQIARDLLGKILVTEISGRITSGIIFETEAYAGVSDKASHAYGGRRTNRTEVMYREGGIAYVYLCYGIHSLFNVVTNKAGIPHAVLIRSIIPLEGEEIMLKRAKRNKVDFNLGNGPGKISKILGIHYTDTGTILSRKKITSERKIWIEDSNLNFIETDVTESKRVGVDYADADADLPYRFIIKKPRNISGFFINY